LRRTRIHILLAATFFLLATGVVEAQTPSPTPPGPNPYIGPLEPTPGGPPAPTNLTARWGPLPDNPQASGVLLTWQDNAEDETSQVVQRKDPGGAEWQDKAYAPANYESTDDRGFEAPGEYCYRIFVVGGSGASVSNETCVQVPEATVHGLPPGAPPPNNPTVPPGLRPSNPTVPAGLSPAAAPASGGGSGRAGMPGLSWPLASIVFGAAALVAAGAATWRVVATRRGR